MAGRWDGAHVVFYRKLKTFQGRRVPAILLAKRTLDAPTAPGCWSLIGGRIEPDEKPIETALRESREELFHRSRLRLRFLCKIKRRRNGQTYIVYFFLAPLNEDMDTLRLKRSTEGRRIVEGGGLGWFTKAEIRSLRVRQQDRPAIS